MNLRLTLALLVLWQWGLRVAAADPCVGSTATLSIRWGIFTVPATNTISANTAVTWTNVDQGRNHSIVQASPGTLNSGVIMPGGTFCNLFTVPGTFRYSSPEVGFMLGTLTINPLPTTTATTTSTATQGQSGTGTLAPTTSSGTTQSTGTPTTGSVITTTATTATPTTATPTTAVATTTLTSSNTATATTTGSRATSSTASITLTPTSTASISTTTSTSTSINASTSVSESTTPTPTPTPTAPILTPSTAPTEPPIPLQDTAVLYLRGLDYQSVVSNNDDFSFCFRAAVVSSLSVPLSSVAITSISEGSVIVGFNVLEFSTIGGNSTTLVALEGIVSSGSSLSATFLSKLTTLLHPSYFEDQDQSKVEIVSLQSGVAQSPLLPPTPEPITLTAAVSIILVSFATLIFYMIIASVVISSVVKMARNLRVKGGGKKAVVV